MGKVFLNHKSQEKKLVKAIQQHLESCLIQTWLDEEQLRPGHNLLNEIYSGVTDNNYFVAFISERYLDSAWCLRELDTAEVNNNIKIIPVVIGNSKVIMEKATPTIKSLLSRNKYIELNEYDLPQTAQAIAQAIWQNHPVRFLPVRIIEIEGVKLQLIEFDADKDIPNNLFKTWDFKIDDFLHTSSSSDGKEKPIKGDIPVAIYGRGPAWLFAFLSIPLANMYDIFLYNYGDKSFICVHAQRSSDNLGNVLKWTK